MEHSDARKEDQPFDPTFLHARKEAILILIAWVVCLVWTVGLSAVMGYSDPDTPVTFLFGIPTWVFWGVMVPWGAATAFSIWFGLSYMKDDDLGESGVS